MFTAALFITAKIWKQPKCPLIDEWIKKMFIYIYTYIHICIYVYIYTHTYIYMHTHTVYKHYIYTLYIYILYTYTYTMEYYSAIGKNEILPFAATGMDLP